jgi:hypothetical protein
VLSSSGEAHKPLSAAEILLYEACSQPASLNRLGPDPLLRGPRAGLSVRIGVGVFGGPSRKLAFDALGTFGRKSQKPPFNYPAAKFEIARRDDNHLRVHPEPAD